MNFYSIPLYRHNDLQKTLTLQSGPRFETKKKEEATLFTAVSGPSRFNVRGCCLAAMTLDATIKVDFASSSNATKRNLS